MKFLFIAGFADGKRFADQIDDFPSLSKWPFDRPPALKLFKFVMAQLSLNTPQWLQIMGSLSIARIL
jgi:hypothetical protein